MLQPLETTENVPQLVNTSTSPSSAALDAELDDFDDGLDPEIEEIDVVDTQPSTDLRTFKERLLGHAKAIKDFACSASASGDRGKRMNFDCQYLWFMLTEGLPVDSRESIARILFWCLQWPM